MSNYDQVLRKTFGFLDSTKFKNLGTSTPNTFNNTTREILK